MRAQGEVLLDELPVRIFADGADKAKIAELASNPLIRGFTTNPTLMRQAGVADYVEFAHEILAFVDDRPISFEVFSDEFEEMFDQGMKIASWADNVYVKIPISNTKGESSERVVRQLADIGVKVNVTAITTLEQVATAAAWLEDGSPSFLSVFAGRIADTGRDPTPIMRTAVEMLRNHSNIELIWASPREVLNIIQAAEVGCDIITVTHDLLGKLELIGRDLNQFSLETVRMFYRDAEATGYRF